MSAAAIQSISAVTLAVVDMARAVEFYQKLGFEIFHGGPRSGFSSLRAGEAVVNLAVSARARGGGWGRIIFRVSDVDAVHRRALAQELAPDSAPEDASWGERFFHIHDPDGHELSFAELLSRPGG